jgi:hypothetical protein
MTINEVKATRREKALAWTDRKLKELQGADEGTRLLGATVIQEFYANYHRFVTLGVIADMCNLGFLTMPEAAEAIQLREYWCRVHGFEPADFEADNF